MKGVGPVLVVASLSVVAACTLGLGNYDYEYQAKGDTAARGASAPSPSASNQETPPPDSGEEPPPAVPSDGGPVTQLVDAEAGPPPCRHGATETCTTPHGSANDAGSCVGERSCASGVWSACQVLTRCPSTWPPPAAGVTECKNVDVKGNSAHWLESRMVSGDVQLWALDRKTPWELYGLTDEICFLPRQQGNCYSTSTASVQLECTNAKRGLSGDDFQRGGRGSEICLKNPGPRCVVVDKHQSAWEPGGGTSGCERWFEVTRWQVKADPRCTW